MRQYDLSSLTVLILDDNPHFATILRTILRGFGLRSVFECYEVFEALEVLKTQNIDLAFVDFNMPDKNGLDFVHMVRQSPDSRHNVMPIVMVSGDSSRRAVTQAINCGAEEFLAKPFRPADIYRRVVSLIENPHTYVRTKGGYFGPDRRRNKDLNFDRAEQRRADTAVIEDVGRPGILN